MRTTLFFRNCCVRELFSAKVELVSEILSSFQLYFYLSFLPFDSLSFSISSGIHFKLYFLIYLIDRTRTTRWFCSYTCTICSHSTALLSLHSDDAHCTKLDLSTAQALQVVELTVYSLQAKIVKDYCNPAHIYAQGLHEIPRITLTLSHLRSIFFSNNPISN